MLPLNLLPTVTSAAVPALQVTPLQYTGTLTPGHSSQGFVDVANPTDSPVEVQASVRGWRQTGTSGDLQFFDNPDLAAAISVDQSNFMLGPREALRDSFAIDATKLPRGGVYAAIFFRTSPPPQSSSSSFVVQSANVGTLLILTNGQPGPAHGALTLNLPLWQFGSGLHGAFAFTNTDHSQAPAAIKTSFTSRILPWGHAAATTSGLVLPGYTRQFDFSRPGSYFGPLPIAVTDSATRARATSWVFALTGFYVWLVPVLVVLATFGILLNKRRKYVLADKA